MVRDNGTAETECSSATVKRGRPIEDYLVTLRPQEFDPTLDLLFVSLVSGEPRPTQPKARQPP